MIDDHLTPEEQKLTEHLRAMPRRTLRPAARAAIREQMMSEFRARIDSPEWQPEIVERRRVTPVLLRTVGLVATLAIVAAVVFAQEAIRQAATTSTITPAPTELQPTQLQAITLVPSSTTTLAPSPENTPTPLNQEVVPATSVPFTLAPSDTLTPAPPTTAPVVVPPTAVDGAGVVVVEGPVSRIDGNRITIYSFDIEIAPQDPILASLAVGDMVHVEGSLAPSGVMIASTVGRFVSAPPADGTAGAAIVNGRVEAINGNQLVANGVPVRLTPGDPILQRLKVGDLVEIWGTFEGSVLIPTQMTISTSAPASGNPAPPSNNGNPSPQGMGNDDNNGNGSGNGMGMGMGDDD